MILSLIDSIGQQAKDILEAAQPYGQAGLSELSLLSVVIVFLLYLWRKSILDQRNNEKIGDRFSAVEKAYNERMEATEKSYNERMDALQRAYFESMQKCQESLSQGMKENSEAQQKVADILGRATDQLTRVETLLEKHHELSLKFITQALEERANANAKFNSAQT